MSTVLLKIRRRDEHDESSYWEQFSVPYTAGMTVLDAIRLIDFNPTTTTGDKTAPVAFDCSCSDGMCGACAMTICGRARLACSTPVDACADPIVIEPLKKFPVVRDLVVDRSAMFDTLAPASCSIPCDEIEAKSYPRAISKEDTMEMQRFLGCSMCGICIDTCPSTTERAAFTGPFIFPAIYALNLHPTGKMGAPERMDFAMSRRGISDCNAAKNCEMVCPMGIPVPEAISKIGWLALKHGIKRMLW